MYSGIIWQLFKDCFFGITFPFILRMMPSETVGIWTIFMSITAFTSLLDFGFNPSFTRNVSFVFSGIRELKVNGFSTKNIDNTSVDYSLLKDLFIQCVYFIHVFQLSYLLF